MVIGETLAEKTVKADYITGIPLLGFDDSITGITLVIFDSGCGRLLFYQHIV